MWVVLRPSKDWAKCLWSRAVKNRYVIKCFHFNFEKCFSSENNVNYLSIARLPQTYEDGEILCEAEPIRYELRDIKINKFRTHVVRNKTLLGETKLENAEDGANNVGSAIIYKYDRVLYWGTVEGVSRGIPTDVYETGKPVMKISWGMREEATKTDVSAKALYIYIW